KLLLGPSAEGGQHTENQAKGSEQAHETVGFRPVSLRYGFPREWPTARNLPRSGHPSLILPVMTRSDLYDKALRRENLSVEEGVLLFTEAPLAELMYIGDTLRKEQVPHGMVTWIID